MMMRRNSIIARLGILAPLLLVALFLAARICAQESSPLTHAQPVGGLSGATIFVNPGHGWMYDSKTGRWITQRGVTHGLIEDHSNAEAVLQFLVPYLWNAGAKVETTRERDLQSNMVIVEAGGEGFTQAGEWEDVLARGAWSGSQRASRTKKAGAWPANEPIGFCSFTPDIPEDGYYAVYAWYAPMGRDTMARDARFGILHTGGMSTWIQDQNVDGCTWRYMGRYYFEKGRNPATGSVRLYTTSSASGKFVSIGAVRFGGGIGESGHPRWEESGLHYAQFMGYNISNDTRNANTVSAMPMFAEWEAEPFEKGKSIYAAWHTNASGGKSRGLFSFVYGPDEWAGMERFTGYPGGVELVTSVHKEIIQDVHAAYDPEWREGAIVTRWLGETNPRNNGKMPAALWEMGFHDNAQDAGYILDPRFRQIVARAVYHGIVKYYRENVPGFEKAKLLPEPPRNFAAHVNKDGSITLSWRPPESDRGNGVYGDRATGYRIYRSLNGKGFDNGLAVEKTSKTFSRPVTGETTYFRVTAVNDGGESFPTETLAARVNYPDKPRLLIVNGFDRLDRGLNVPDGTSERGILSKMNTFDYVIQHASAIGADFSISSTSNEALMSGAVRMSNHDAVIWILGQESGETDALNAQEMDLLGGYLHSGGALFISGSDAAGDIAKTEEGAQFLRELFRVKLVNNDSGSHTIGAPPGVAGSAPSIFEGIPDFTLDTGTGRTYPVKTPDALAPTGGSQVAFVYSGGEAAALQYEAKHRVLYFGFPFESINESGARSEIMRRSLQYLIRKNQ